MNWGDVKQGDVLHYDYGSHQHSYLVVSDPEPCDHDDGCCCVSFKMLHLDSGKVCEVDQRANTSQISPTFYRLELARRVAEGEP